MPVAIASVGDSTYTFDDFTAFLRATRKPATPSSPAHFHKLTDDFLDRKGFDHAVATLADRDEDFGRLMAEYEEGILLFAVSEDSVWNPASADSMALVSLFEKNRDSLWYPERRRIIGFQTRVDSALSLISSRFEAGEPMAAIFDSARTWAADMRIDTTFIADSTFSVYDSTLKLEEGQNSGILQTRSGSMFLYFDAMEAPREKTFEEARADLVSMHQETLEENWIERLRKRYRVRTFPQRLSHVHGSLNAEPAK